jgi:N-ethylmaleimide reductase
MSRLFTSVTVGSLELPNRIVMSPMTRIRAGAGCVPTVSMARYYAQRASAGLIITEGTHPGPMRRGYTHPPGLHTEEQAAGWRKVTDAVHTAGGRIFVQLMHAGRVSHSSLLPAHALPVAPSAIPVSGEVHTFGGKEPFETPRPLETGEIAGVVAEYRRAAELSVEASFDGVELHAATGYLPNQFQVTGSNHRTDAYGGSLEKRTRFTLEVIEAL